MMEHSQPKPTGWAQRLRDWEQTAPARPGEGPAPGFWDRLEPDLPPPPRRAAGPFELWLLLGLLFLTHFTCFRAELGHFPLPTTTVVETSPATPADEQGTPPEATALAAGPLAAAPDTASAERTTAFRTPAPPQPELPAAAASLTELPAVSRDTAFAEKTAAPRPSRPGVHPPEAPSAGVAPPAGATAFAERTAPPYPALLPGRNLPLVPNPALAGLPTTTRDTAFAELSVPAAATPRARAKERKQGAWQLWAGAHYAPVSNRTRLTIDPGVLTASRTRQIRAPEVGANLYLQFGDHWGLRTGFTANRIETESQYRFIRFFNPLFEAPNNAGEGVSKYSVEVASAYAKSSAEVELVRPQDRNLQNGARLRIDLRIRETVVLQSIPLQVTYTNRWGRFALSGQLGPEWTHVNVRDFTAAARVQRPGLRTDRVRIQSREPISRSSYWSLAGGIAASYDLADRWRASLIPEFTTSLDNLSDRPGFAARSRSASVRIELAYQLR